MYPPVTMASTLVGFEQVLPPWSLVLLAGIALALLAHNHWLRHKLKLQLHRLQESEQRLRLITDNMTDFVWVVSADNRMTYVSPSVYRMLGYRPEELIGQPMEYALDPESTEFVFELQEKLLTAAKRGEHGETMDTTTEVAQRHKQGHRVWTEVAIRVFLSPEGDFAGAQGSSRSINERKKAQQAIWEMAFYDPLTQLPNRRLFSDRLTQALVNCAREQLFCAVYFLDLDNFKQINDAEGHDSGDLLLKAVATRLQDGLRESDTVARYGGDEFVVLSSFLGPDPLEARERARQLGEKIQNLFSRPFEFSGRSYQVNVSIGAALSRGERESERALLRSADLAMYEAKAQGRNQLVVSQSIMH